MIGALALLGLLANATTGAPGAGVPARSPPVFAQAIVIGANRSVDRDLAPLRYADDDAARFAELFGELGIKTHLLARADESTRRLHGDVLASARLPILRDLRAAVAEARGDAEQARRRGQRSVLYVVFAGHGNVDRDRGYLTLEDARLYAGDVLDGIVGQVAPAQAHVIVDACHSYLFALSRGAGGTHHPAQGFFLGALGAGATDVGFLLSSNPSGESHEWEAFQSGVFSHEVRSGLVGGADANGDGVVAYRELAAFVSRANDAIVNDHYRPKVYARPPRDSDVLLDLRGAPLRHLRVDGLATGKHFLVEDSRGVRWADFHAGQPFKVLLPARHTPLYVRRLADAQETRVEGGAEAIVLSEQSLRPAESETRGAAHHAFKTLFSLPFDQQAVLSFRPKADEVLVEARPARWWGTRRYLGVAVLAGAAAAAGTGAYHVVASNNLESSVDSNTSQQTTAGQITAIDRHDRYARWLLGSAAVAAAGGLALLLWPASDAAISVAPAQGGATVQLTWRR